MVVVAGGDCGYEGGHGSCGVEVLVFMLVSSATFVMVTFELR
jgi:hypothetical protein